MPQRRQNDAQVERLLAALKDTSYRQALAKKQVGIKLNAKLPAKGTAKRTAYDSEMRRLQRYVTDAGEKRSFAKSPLPYRRELRARARALPPPPELRPPPKARPLPLPTTPDETPFFRKIPPIEPPEDYEPFAERHRERDINLYDLRAIIAYHDGDAHEAARVLGVGRQGENLLDLARDGVDVFAARGSGKLTDAARDFFDAIPQADADDIDDFLALLMNLPDWEIGMILEDLEHGDSTFADVLDAWRADGMKLDGDDLTDSQYWALWREIYKRLTG